MSIKTFPKSLTSAIFIHHILPENTNPMLILFLLENITLSIKKCIDILRLMYIEYGMFSLRINCAWFPVAVT